MKPRPPEVPIRDIDPHCRVTALPNPDMDKLIPTQPIQLTQPGTGSLRWGSTFRSNELLADTGDNKRSRPSTEFNFPSQNKHACVFQLLSFRPSVNIKVIVNNDEAENVDKGY